MVGERLKNDACPMLENAKWILILLLVFTPTPTFVQPLSNLCPTVLKRFSKGSQYVYHRSSSQRHLVENRAQGRAGVVYWRDMPAHSYTPRFDHTPRRRRNMLAPPFDSQSGRAARRRQLQLLGPAGRSRIARIAANARWRKAHGERLLVDVSPADALWLLRRYFEQLGDRRALFYLDKIEECLQRSERDAD